MNKVKICDFVDVYSKVNNLNSEYNEILKKLMINIISFYEKTNINISVIEDSSETYLIKAVNGYYSVEDFFLNRLMRNVMNINIFSTLNEYINNTLGTPNVKGSFSSDINDLNINGELLNEIYKKYGNKKADTFVSKVIMHEFEHALQTKYENKISCENREKYNQLLSSLSSYKNGIYNKALISNSELNSLFTDYEYEKSKPIFCGAGFRDNSLNRKNKYFHLDKTGLVETLNERESLIMSGIVKPEYRIRFNDGSMQKVFDPDSGNKYNVNFAYLLNLLVGEKILFKGMYINPDILYNELNKYNDIFLSEYNMSNNVDSTMKIMQILTNIYENHKIEDINKLNFVLVKCIIKKIKNNLSNHLFSNDEAINMLRRAKQFSTYTDMESSNHEKLINNTLNILENNSKDKQNNDNNLKDIISIYDYLGLRYQSNEYETLVTAYQYIKDNQYADKNINYIKVNGKVYRTEVFLTKLLNMANLKTKVVEDGIYSIDINYMNDIHQILISNKGIKTSDFNLINELRNRIMKM